MSSASKAAERRSAKRKSLARKAEARKTRVTKQTVKQMTTGSDKATATGSSRARGGGTSSETASGSSNGTATNSGKTSGRSGSNAKSPAQKTNGAETANRRTTGGGSTRSTGRASKRAASAKDGPSASSSGSSKGTSAKSNGPPHTDEAKLGNKNRRKADVLDATGVTVEKVVDKATSLARTGVASSTGADGGRWDIIGGVLKKTGTIKPTRPGALRLRRNDRQGGVAPFTPPKRRLGRVIARKHWYKRGFVPVSPGRVKVRHKILPRSVIGISFSILVFAVGMAFSGAAFYAYYDNRLAENEEMVARFVEGFDAQFSDAAGALDEMRVGAIEDIRTELSPLGEYVSQANGVIGLPQMIGESVWQLETADENGRPITGSAFAVASHNGGTALATSYSLVVASATNPSPPIDLVKGDERVRATLWAWDADTDLAVVVVDREIPPLDMAGQHQQRSALGANVFAVSGIGGQGASASPGLLIDQSAAGIQHTAPVTTLFAGGPLVTGDGVVLGIVSTNYRPFGVDAAGQINQAPDLSALCDQLLRCVDNSGDLTAELDGGTGQGASEPATDGATDADADAQAETGAEAETGAGVDAEAEAETGAGVDAGADPETDDGVTADEGEG